MIHYSYTQHIFGRGSLLRSIGDSALDVLAPALVHEGTGTVLGPRSSEIRIRFCVECLCVCLPPLSGVALGRGDFKSVPLCL